MKYVRTLSLYLAFSFIAAVLITLLVIMTPDHTSPISFLEKVGLAGLFLFCCIIGISFTLHPNWVRRYFSKFKDKEKNTQQQVKRSFQGHHPDCPTFQNHTIHWNKKTWCAGCLGLFIGLCASMVLMILYVVTDFQLTNMMSYLLILLGLFILPVVYIEILYRSRYAIVHVIINSLMSLSFFIIIIAVGELTGKFVYGFFTILLCFLWLDVRIQLSKWHHGSLCKNCFESCKMFLTFD